MSAAPAAAQPQLLDPYRALVAHAELEHELACRGDLPSLNALGGRWEALLEGLPAAPPAEAAQLLHRARLIHERTREELIGMREALVGDAAVASRAQRAATGYGGERSPSGFERRA
jgi:hypothetical protein